MGEKLIRRCLAALLESPNWTLTVAAPSTGGDTIYGWILWKPGAVAWVNVKDDGYRGRGFGRALLQATGWTGGSLKTPFQPAWSKVPIKLRPDLLLREILA